MSPGSLARHRNTVASPGPAPNSGSASSQPPSSGPARVQRFAPTSLPRRIRLAFASPPPRSARAPAVSRSLRRLRAAAAAFGAADRRVITDDANAEPRSRQPRRGVTARRTCRRVRCGNGTGAAIAEIVALPVCRSGRVRGSRERLRIADFGHLPSSSPISGPGFVFRRTRRLMFILATR